MTGRVMMVMIPIMRSPATFQAGDVRALTGLSPSQLREWTSRRGILPADQPARGRGKHAQYAWNTVLVLRLLVELHRSFKIEISAWARPATALRDSLIGTSPIALYGKYAEVRPSAIAITANPAPGALAPTITVPLDPHLEALAVGLGVAPPPAQLNLFPAVRA